MTELTVSMKAKGGHVITARVSEVNAQMAISEIDKVIERFTVKLTLEPGQTIISRIQ